MGANSHAQLKQLTTHSPCRRAWMATFNQSKAVPTAQKTVGGFLHGNDARQGVDDESRRSPIFVEKNRAVTADAHGSCGSLCRASSDTAFFPKTLPRRENVGQRSLSLMPWHTPPQFDGISAGCHNKLIAAKSTIADRSRQTVGDLSQNGYVNDKINQGPTHVATL